jgi:SAM-dependent MidA family methyltransferase
MNPKPEAALPAPDADSEAHSRLVAAHIGSLIDDAGGSISFAEYMHEALYAPGLGYYSAGARKLGRDGDFVTAPEISALFGYVVARQAAFVLEQLGGGDLLEPGAGSGALAVSILKRLATLQALPERYLVLEVSPELQARQQEKLFAEIPQLAERVSWVSEMPADFTGVVVANEVADALPFERFRISGDAVLQARVERAGEGFGWTCAPAPDALAQAVREIETAAGKRFANGFESEWSPAVRHWVQDLCQSLNRGFVMLIDYGVTRREYYATDRNGGWLRCHFRHRAHSDPLVLPGIQDLTTWVDFSMVAEAAAETGMQVSGYTTQAGFLMHGGLEAELEGFAELSTEEQVMLSGQVKKLTLPAEMGENFKCIGLSRGKLTPPPAFREPDRAHWL